MFFALFRKKPVDLIICSSSSRSAAANAAASGYRAKSAGVTMLTRTSVHWAERIVAISNCSGDWWRRAHSASGYSFARPARRRAARRFSGVTLLMGAMVGETREAASGYLVFFHARPSAASIWSAHAGPQEPLA